MKKTKNLSYFIIFINICYLIVDVFYFFNERIKSINSKYIAYEFPLETNAIVFLKWGLLILISFLFYKKLNIYKLWVNPLIGIISALILLYFLYGYIIGSSYRGSFVHNFLLLEIIAVFNLIYLFFIRKRG